MNGIRLSTAADILIHAFKDFRLLHLRLVQRVDHLVFIDRLLDLASLRKKAFVFVHFRFEHAAVPLRTDRVKILRVIAKLKKNSDSGLTFIRLFY